jgi:hypothetical protein
MTNNTKEMLPISEWKRLTVIDCKFSKNDLVAQVPFLQPFDFNVFEGLYSSFDVADRILERTMGLFTASRISSQETIMFEGQLDECLKKIYPYKHYLRYQWEIEEEEPLFNFDDEFADPEVIKVPSISSYDDIQLDGYSLVLAARLPAGTEEPGMPIIICAKYQAEEEEEILRQLKSIEKV